MITLSTRHLFVRAKVLLSVEYSTHIKIKKEEWPKPFFNKFKANLKINLELT